MTLGDVLKDIDLGRVSIDRDGRITLTGVFVDPTVRPAYETTVRVLLDQAWVMSRHPDGGLLMLTTLGQIKLIQGAKEVTV
jgi:hypothetical protein